MEATLQVETTQGWAGGKGWNGHGESTRCPNERSGYLDEGGDAANEQKGADLILVSGGNAYKYELFLSSSPAFPLLILSV